MMHTVCVETPLSVASSFIVRVPRVQGLYIQLTIAPYRLKDAKASPASLQHLIPVHKLACVARSPRLMCLHCHFVPLCDAIALICLPVNPLCVPSFTSHRPSPDWIHSQTAVCTGLLCAPFLSEASSGAGCSPPSYVAPPLCTGHASRCLGRDTQNTLNHSLGLGDPKYTKVTIPNCA